MSLQPNPNESLNRAPRGEQLASFRDKEYQRHNVINQITHNARTATATYESIRARYDEQFLVLEKIQSEMQVAKALMESWKELAASSDLETQQLQAQLQPILRYTDDNLRLIFEEYVAHSKRPFSAAVTLSHVCQHWRDVAISTSTLWKSPVFTGVKNSEALKSQAQAFIDRVGRVPAEILIYIHGPAINSGKTIPFDLIYAAPTISVVELRVSCRGDNPSIIFDAIDHSPRGDVESLRIHLKDRVPVPFCPGAFISKFSGVRGLKLQGFSFELPISPTLSSALASITRVHLEALNHLAITQLLRLMRNNLQNLTVKQCELVPSSEPQTERYVMHLLCTLTVECIGFPWNKIQCPKLAHLVVPDHTHGLNGEYFWQFCSTTEFITSVSINLDRGDLEQFTRLAHGPHRLRTLEILYPTNKDIVSVLVRHDGLDRPPFPELLHLTFKKVHKELKANTLDSLVQRRCFSRGHPESRMDPGIANALERFEITTETGATDWECSRYLAKYFEMARSPSLRSYRFVGKFGLDSGC